jgi:hypothetical protein
MLGMVAERKSQQERPLASEIMASQSVLLAKAED